MGKITKMTENNVFRRLCHSRPGHLQYAWILYSSLILSLAMLAGCNNKLVLSLPEDTVNQPASGTAMSAPEVIGQPGVTQIPDQQSTAPVVGQPGAVKIPMQMDTPGLLDQPVGSVAVGLNAPGMLDQPSESISSAIPRYIIQPGDKLHIKFFYNNLLNQEITVRPDGYISLQLVQEVKAASLTTTELTNVLTKKYSAFLKDPEISVLITSFDKQKIFVDGEVYYPKMIEMGGYMTIMQAISVAGGLKISSYPEEVIVIRRNGLKKPFVLAVNLAEARDGSDVTQDIALKPNDIIFVPKSAIANVNDWVKLYIRNNLPIGVGYSVPNE